MNTIYFVLFTLPIIFGQKLNRDPIEKLVQLNEPGSGLRLKCHLNYTVPRKPNEEKETIEWFYIDKEETKVDESHIRVNEETGQSALVMGEKYVKSGGYTCRVTSSKGGQLSQTWAVESFKVNKLDQSKTFIAGDDVILKCQLKEHSDMDGALTFKWYLVPEEDPKGKGELLTNSTAKSGEIDPHIRIGLPQPDLSVLKIEDALYEDRSIYRCVAELAKSGENIVSTTQILVRIKDKYSALYPFIGIVAEVIALSLIIFICERRKSSDGLDEDDEEYNGGVSAGNGNSNLRHRRN